MRTLIASDWHLGTYSPPGTADLARRFLDRARASGDRVILNGDIFEGLFESLDQAEAAHAALRDQIAEMTQLGQLSRTAGNHDPESGVASVVLDHPVLGRVLVAHGHAVDPLHGSPVGRLGDAISRRIGYLTVVRGAARMAEHVANRVVGMAMERTFRARCRGMIGRERCELGVFGHIHRRYLAPTDNYANAGYLTPARLEYLVLTDDSLHLAQLEAGDRARNDAARTVGDGGRPRTRQRWV